MNSTSSLIDRQDTNVDCIGNEMCEDLDEDPSDVSAETILRNPGWRGGGDEVVGNTTVSQCKVNFTPT